VEINVLFVLIMHEMVKNQIYEINIHEILLTITSQVHVLVNGTMRGRDLMYFKLFCILIVHKENFNLTPMNRNRVLPLHFCAQATLCASRLYI
jgi:hypothetical protein